jgi:hypothetical protein
MIELVCLLSLGFMSNNLQSGERNISGVGLFSGISSPSLVAANFWREMELPNQLYYNSVQDKTDSVATPIANYTPQKVHVVDLSETPAVVSDN